MNTKEPKRFYAIRVPHLVGDGHRGEVARELPSLLRPGVPIVLCREGMGLEAKPEARRAGRGWGSGRNPIGMSRCCDW